MCLLRTFWRLEEINRVISVLHFTKLWTNMNCLSSYCDLFQQAFPQYGGEGGGGGGVTGALKITQTPTWQFNIDNVAD